MLVTHSPGVPMALVDQSGLQYGCNKHLCLISTWGLLSSRRYCSAATEFRRWRGRDLDAARETQGRRQVAQLKATEVSIVSKECWKRDLSYSFHYGDLHKALAATLAAPAQWEPATICAAIFKLCHWRTDDWDSSPTTILQLPDGFAALQRLQAEVLAQLGAFTPDQLADLLCDFAALVTAQNQLPDVVRCRNLAWWQGQLLSGIAAVQLVNPTPPLTAFSSRGLTSVICAFGAMSPGLTSQEQSYMDKVLEELEVRMAAPAVWMSPTDLTATALALAQQACAGTLICLDTLWQASPTPAAFSSRDLPREAAGYPSTAKRDGAVSSRAASPPHLSHLSHRFWQRMSSVLDGLAMAVRNTLANKHSGHTPFTPHQVVQLVGAYAAVEHHSASAASMLDAVAGYVVQRIEARHLNAVSKPADLAALAASYATLCHTSVAVPALLEAVGVQLRRHVASEAQREPEVEGSLDEQQLNPALLLALLDAYRQLGYHPGNVLLTAVGPAVWQQQAAFTPWQAARLLSLLADFQHHPGNMLLAALADRLKGQLRDLPQEVLNEAVESMAVLGFTPSAALQAELVSLLQQCAARDQLQSMRPCMHGWAMAVWGNLTLDGFSLLAAHAANPSKQDQLMLYQAWLSLGQEEAVSMLHPWAQAATAAAQHAWLAQVATRQEEVSCSAKYQTLSARLTALGLSHRTAAATPDGQLLLGIELTQGCKAEVTVLQVLGAGQHASNPPSQLGGGALLMQRILQSTGYALRYVLPEKCQSFDV